MQKPQLNSPVFLAVQNTYKEFELALFQGYECIATLHEDNKLASKKLIPLLKELLSKNQKTLNDLSFIAVNQGPGPFTTLRTIIASVNGLSFATHIPLIGIDGLLALLEEYQNPEYPDTIALLNAFNKDVYFAIEKPGKKIETGYKNIYDFLTDISGTPPAVQNFKTNVQEVTVQETIRFIGNGTDMYKDVIQEALQDNAYIPETIPQTCSINQIAKIGLAFWNKQQDLTDQLLPLYLKKHPAQR